MRNWFNTLWGALESENIQDWPMDGAVSYGETRREFINGECVTVYRDERGMYERPVHYRSLMS